MIKLTKSTLRFIFLKFSKIFIVITRKEGHYKYVLAAIFKRSMYMIK